MNRRFEPLESRGPLNVMFLITSMPVGGAEVLLSQLVRGLDRERFRPSITCLKERGELGGQIADEFSVHQNLIGGKYDVGVLGRLVKLFHENAIDAVVTVGAGDKMFWGRLAAKRARLPVIVSAIHSTGWPDQIGRMNRILTPITDAFVAVAESHGQFLVTDEKFPSRKVAVIPNGIDTERFQPDMEARSDVRSELGIEPDAPCCGIVAALRPEKNHLLFLRMAKEVSQKVPEANFLIIGDGPERRKIETAVQVPELKSRVHLLGTRKDTPRLLAALDCFALTSHMEASPVSILEAMSCEVPVVATDVGSIHETVEPGVSGFLSPSGDAAQLSRHVTSVLQDSELRKAMGQSARSFVCKNASLESMVGGYERLIESIYQAKATRDASRETVPTDMLTASATGSEAATAAN